MHEFISSFFETLSMIIQRKDLFNILNLTYLIAVIVLLFVCKSFLNGTIYHIPKGTSLVGKYAVVTGGNSGIGAYTVKQLASLGCQVIIGARNRQTAQIVIKDIHKSYPQSKVDFIELQLSNRDSIKTFAENICFPRIDFLVNNAGIVYIPSRKLTREGVEMTWGVNHLGHFYLTFLLWDKITKSEFFRVINVSSITHKTSLPLVGFKTTLDFDNINLSTQYNRSLAYCRSKLYIVLFTRALAEKIKAKKGLTASLHPGIVRTQMMRETLSAGIVGKIFELIMTALWPIYCFFTKNAQQGSYTTLFTLLSPEVQNGCYYADCKKDSQNPLVIKQNWDRLWQISENILGIKFIV